MQHVVTANKFRKGLFFFPAINLLLSVTSLCLISNIGNINYDYRGPHTDYCANYIKISFWIALGMNYERAEAVMVDAG